MLSSNNRQGAKQKGHSGFTSEIRTRANPKDNPLRKKTNDNIRQPYLEFADAEVAVEQVVFFAHVFVQIGEATEGLPSRAPGTAVLEQFIERRANQLVLKVNLRGKDARLKTMDCLLKTKNCKQM